MKALFIKARLFLALLLFVFLVNFYWLIDTQYGVTYIVSVFKGDDWLDKGDYQTSDEYFKAFEVNHISTVRQIKPERYVYVVPSNGGYGNKMYSIISGFLLALITNSAIIITWPEIDNYIQEPLPLSFLPDPTRTKNELSFMHRPKGLYRFPNLSPNAFNPVKTLLKMQHVPSRSRYLLKKSVAPLFLEFACYPKHFDKLRKYNLVRNETLNKSLKVNRQLGLQAPNYHLNDLYQVGFEAAHNILNKYWRPKEHIQIEVERFVDQNFASNYLIGIQMRHYYLIESDLMLFVECARRIESRLNLSKVKWFITSDNSDYVSKIKAIEPDKVVHVLNGAVKHVVTDSDGYYRAILDNEILSKCNQIIMTSGSTFGFLAVIRNGKVIPWYVNGKQNSTRCERFQFDSKSITHQFNLVV